MVAMPEPASNLLPRVGPGWERVYGAGQKGQAGAPAWGEVMSLFPAVLI